MTRMEVQISGGGTNANKTMFFLGMLFVVLGALIGLPWLIIPIIAGIPLLGIGGILFAGVFCGVGGFFAYIGRQSMNAGKETLEESASDAGKSSANEEDESISINVSCPNCGANVVVPLGMSRFCPYCDTKLSLTREGELVKAG